MSRRGAVQAISTVRQTTMVQNRVTFTGAWLTGVVALLFFPGFEVKGLVGGLIIGYWPFFVWRPSLENELLVLSLLFVLSGLQIGICAWAMDRAKLAKTAWIVLLILVTVGAAVGYAVQHDRFESWKQSPAIVAAMNSPELNYEPSPRDFHTSILIPVMLMCGMWGLYFATAGCAFVSIVRLVRGVLRRSSRTCPTSGCS